MIQKTISGTFAIFVFMKVTIEKSSKSVLSSAEKELLDLSLGRIEPKTEYQKTVKKQIKEIENKGQSVDIPSN